MNLSLRFMNLRAIWFYPGNLIGRSVPPIGVPTLLAHNGLPYCATHSATTRGIQQLHVGVPLGPRAGFATRFWGSASGLVSWGSNARSLHTQPMVMACELSSMR